MAIEAREFTEKDELVVKLKKVSDGLSVIAEENQKIARAKQQLSELQTATKQSFEDFFKKTEVEKQKKEALDREIEHCEKKIAELTVEKEDIENSKPKHYAQLKKGLLITSAIIAVVMAIICLTIGEQISGFSSIASGVVGDILNSSRFIMLFAVFLAYSSVCPILAFRERNNRGKKLRAEALEDVIADIEETESIISASYEELKNLNKSYEEFLTKKPSDAKLKSFEKKVKEEIIPESTAKINQTKNKLNEETRDILAEEDWRNAGTLVYYLKTGRADSLKEALLMVDEQKSNEDLIKSIENSTYSITYSVNRMADSMKSFGEEINGAYRETARKFDQSYSDMQYAMESISNRVNAQLNNLNSTIESQGRAIAEAEKKNADLLSHANQNSDELMYNIRYNS